MFSISRHTVKSQFQFKHRLLRLINESSVTLSKRNTSHDQTESSSASPKPKGLSTYTKALALASLAGLAGYYYQQQRRNGRTTFSADEVAKRGFTSYAGGVYDLKAYKLAHPGGEETITELAGKQLEPCWDALDFHHKKEVLELLETMRVGDLKTSGRGPARCKTKKNVPMVNPKEYKLEIVLDKTSDAIKSLSLDDLKRYPRHSIVSAIPCKSSGTKTSETGTTNGRTWTGARLSDVVADLGINKTVYDKLQFECLDSSESGSPSASNVPLEKALDPNFDALLAYEMDGAELSPEHGYPVRVVMTQLAGKKNVKWLSRIVLLSKEKRQDV